MNGVIERRVYNTYINYVKRSNQAESVSEFAVTVNER